MNQLLTVSLRQKAVFIPATEISGCNRQLTETTIELLTKLHSLGFNVSEPLLAALNNTSPVFKTHLLNTFREVMGVKKNWTPLVKGWDIPTGESMTDHIITFFANKFKIKGTKLSCGHTIPGNTFPLHRYNGCPFCGTPFETGEIEHTRQGTKQKVLELWALQDAVAFLSDLLTSKTALDATQMDSLKILLTVLPLPDVQIGMKETLMAVIDVYISLEQPAKAQPLFTSPADVLRYLWYKHTGFLQVIEPKTIIRRKKKNNDHITPGLSRGASAKLLTAAALKLRYSRKEGLMVAGWLNNMPCETANMCEIMHPKRGMWVRFIRALRLAEYSKRKGFDKLRDLLDKFYNKDYEVWQGHVDRYRLRYDANKTFELLKQRPGLFAHSLFANMLWFGADTALAAFTEIIDKVPARLVFTLYMYAENYFDTTNNRVVKTPGGVSKNIAPNHLLSFFDTDQLKSMQSAVADLCRLAAMKRFAAIGNSNRTMYIDPMLFKIPVAIGERSDTVQDLPAALMGTRFAIEGHYLRLFMQWGEGLPAQHLDMDLSCQIAFEGNHFEICSYSNLVATGSKHSGDIRSIPHMIGTAEYIELDLHVLRSSYARYVVFTCNAYSNGSITPNLVVGWMNSLHKMKISETTGVAYDPSCVQHQVRVVNTLTKGLVFGVLDVKRHEIIWLELPFAGQLIQNLDTRNIDAMLKKLESKLSIGELLQIKAEAQGLQLTDTTGADEIYTLSWASNTAAVTKLLIDG
jgi:hypothetical protein